MIGSVANRAPWVQSPVRVSTDTVGPTTVGLTTYAWLRRRTTSRRQVSAQRISAQRVSAQKASPRPAALGARLAPSLARPSLARLPRPIQGSAPSNLVRGQTASYGMPLYYSKPAPGSRPPGSSRQASCTGHGRLMPLAPASGARRTMPATPAGAASQLRGGAPSHGRSRESVRAATRVAQPRRGVLARGPPAGA